MIYHEEPEFWAKDIYWGHSSYWWLSTEERQNKGLPELKPVAVSAV
jgi:hypothetical protein